MQMIEPLMDANGITAARFRGTRMRGSWLAQDAQPTRERSRAIIAE
jgi:hypothetical protein